LLFFNFFPFFFFNWNSKILFGLRDKNYQKCPTTSPDTLSKAYDKTITMEFLGQLVKELSCAFDPELTSPKSSRSNPFQYLEDEKCHGYHKLFNLEDVVSNPDFWRKTKNVNKVRFGCVGVMFES